MIGYYRLAMNQILRGILSVDIFKVSSKKISRYNTDTVFIRIGDVGLQINSVHPGSYSIVALLHDYGMVRLFNPDEQWIPHIAEAYMEYNAYWRYLQ